MSGANAIGLSQMPAKTENNRRTERNVAVSLEQPACLRKWSTRLWRNFRSEWRHALRQVVDTLNILSAWLWYCEYEFGPKKRKFYNTTNDNFELCDAKSQRPANGDVENCWGYTTMSHRWFSLTHDLVSKRLSPLFIGAKNGNFWQHFHLEIRGKA